MSSSTLKQRPTTRAASAALAKSKPSTTTQQTSSIHSHSHSSHDGGEEADALLAAIRGSTDRGSRITLLGLGCNVGLTVVKGAAGYILASAALLADAAHSGSDLLADVVTLTTYRMSRKPVSLSHPYGYGKYESLGSLVVSFLLIGTALGIGLHSYHLLLTTLSSLNIAPELLASLDSVIPHGHSHGHIEGSEAGEVVDARAMWFAAGSIGIKEWLYRVTLKVAKEEHSNVLLANALHHRSDAFGSLVALGAIAGARLGFPVLDPLGGLLVSGMILKQGAEVGITAMKELLDQVTDPSLPPKVHEVLVSLRDPSLPPLPSFTQDSSTSLKSSHSHSSHSHSHHSHSHHSHSHGSGSPSPPPSPTLAAQNPTLPIISIPSIRIFTSGPNLLVDVQLVLPRDLSLGEANEVEEKVREAIIKRLGGSGRVREVVVRLRGEEEE